MAASPKITACHLRVTVVIEEHNCAGMSSGPKISKRGKLHKIVSFNVIGKKTSRKKEKLTPLVSGNQGFRESISRALNRSSSVKTPLELRAGLARHVAPVAKGLRAGLSDSLGKGLSGALHLLDRSRAALASLARHAAGLRVGLSRAFSLGDVLNTSLDLHTGLVRELAPGIAITKLVDGLSKSVGRPLDAFAALAGHITPGFEGFRTALAALAGHVALRTDSDSIGSGSKEQGSGDGGELHFLDNFFGKNGLEVGFPGDIQNERWYTKPILLANEETRKGLRVFI